MKSSKERPLSDLEGATLACIARRKEATAYEIAAEFSRSPADYWSGSAGSVYPLVTRLEQGGLIIGQAGATGKRSRTTYTITGKGREAMLEWLMDAERASGMGFDPLRTRLAYLDLMPELEREAFIQRVTEKTRMLADPPVFKEFPALQALHETWLEARFFWLRHIGKRLLNTRS